MSGRQGSPTKNKKNRLVKKSSPKRSLTSSVQEKQLVIRESRQNVTSPERRIEIPERKIKRNSPERRLQPISRSKSALDLLPSKLQTKTLVINTPPRLTSSFKKISDSQSPPQYYCSQPQRHNRELVPSDQRKYDAYDHIWNVTISKENKKKRYNENDEEYLARQQRLQVAAKKYQQDMANKWNAPKGSKQRGKVRLK